MQLHWTSLAVLKMHELGMSKKELASITGYTPDYIGKLLNRKSNAEKAQKRIMEALDKKEQEAS